MKKLYIIVFVYKIWNIQIHFIIGGIFYEIKYSKVRSFKSKRNRKN